ncbi:MAG TPA: sugar phosphate isomerase/epimerase family protein [Chitinophagaceae bacterium]|nr:sugar phosphate isomerase/epimerase family protein [Chitinophagaceae bacterium]
MPGSISRKEFLQQTGLALALLGTGLPTRLTRSPLLLSFSTLGCPDWSFAQILDFAAAHGYQGIEMRGLLRQMDLTKCNEFSDAAHITETLNRMKEKKLRFVNLGSSCNLHFADPVKRKENLDEGRRFIDLAQQLQCPYVRVFPNVFPKDQDRQATMGLIADGLRELAAYATGKKVMVLMETHGEVVHTQDLLNIMQMTNHPQAGLIWDITNMWTITKEPPATVYPALKKYIHHTHIKDAVLVNSNPSYTFLGKGEVPIFEAIALLQKDGYKGFYSFEWEKMWHPELAAPELALADYPLALKQHGY